MLELTLDKLPGGDATRRQCLARVTLSNTGEGVGGVKTYEVRVKHISPERSPELATSQCRTYREEDEGVLRLLHRSLGKLLGDAAKES